MQQVHSEYVSKSIRSLMTAAVVTKRDPQLSILGRLMHDLVDEVSRLSLIVPSEIYLPAPPIYCPQLFDQDVHDETRQRGKISSILKEIMVVFEACRLHLPLIKWYLDNLAEANDTQKNNLGVFKFKKIFNFNF